MKSVKRKGLHIDQIAITSLFDNEKSSSISYTLLLWNTLVHLFVTPFCSLYNFSLFNKWQYNVTMEFIIKMDLVKPT